MAELNYEVQEQVSLALNTRRIAGDRNYLHLALRLGIPEDVARNLAGMMEVFGHLKMKRVTIGELLRTLRVMERHDVVNLISSAVLENADCFNAPAPDAEEEDDMLGIQEEGQIQLIDMETVYPFPIQECVA